MSRTLKIGIDAVGVTVQFFASKGCRVEVLPNVRKQINYDGKEVETVDYYVEVFVRGCTDELYVEWSHDVIPKYEEEKRNRRW